MNKKISTRTAYGEALAEIGSDPRIFVLDADLQCCTRTEKFGALYPERSRNVGIAEANMVGHRRRYGGLRQDRVRQLLRHVHRRTGL